MCYFISAILQRGPEITEINRIGREYGITFHPCDNTSVKGQLKASEAYFVKVTRGEGCDCGTNLGKLLRDACADGEHAERDDLRRLKRRVGGR